MKIENSRNFVGVFLLALLLLLTFFIMRPILISLVIAVILAFIFNPIYRWIYKKTGMKNISAIAIVIFLIFLIVLPIWFLTPILIKQSFSIFQVTQQIDFVKPLKEIFPSFFASEQFSAEIGSILSAFTTRTANSVVNSLARIILNFPIIALQLMIVLFSFFYLLRDSEHVTDYIKSLLPFSKEVENKLFKYSKEITSSVLYGQVVVGIIQGLIAGIGFFIFGVPNALFLSFLAILSGILPIIGTTIVWLPVGIYLFIAGNVSAGWGVLIFGTFSSTIDNFLRPMIVSRKTKMHSGVVLISMIGGLFFFGILGFILGPLIVSYLIILLEIYRGKSPSGVIIPAEETK